MKHRLFLQGLAAAILTLCAACAADLGDTLAEPQPIVFSAVQLEGETTFTRAATNGTWDGEEQVAIKIGGVVKKYKVADASTGALTPFDSNNTFYRTDKSPITYTAWYPYSPSEPDAPTIVTDQSTTEAQESCNLMTASGTAAYGETAVVQFSHKAARLRLYVNKEGTTTPLTDATIQFSIGGQTYTAHNDGEGYYSILVAPGTAVNEGAAFVRITTNNVNYEGKAPADATFEAGKSYDYHFDLKRSLVHTSVEVTWPSTLPSQAGEVIVKYGNATLTPDTDYELTTIADGLFYTVTITGKGIYTGSIQKKYERDIPYLTFTASKEQGFMMTLPSGFAGRFQYSVNNGEWNTVTSEATVTFGGDNGTLRLRGVSADGTAMGTWNYCTISFTESASVTASGDIRTLVDYENYDTAETGSARFCYLFQNCTALTSAPELPATALAYYCYYEMFRGCTGLTKAPELPAKKLEESCYYKMFYDCTALKTAPEELPATELAESCYEYMFTNCTALKTAPALPATALAESCYESMFEDCTALTSAPALPAKELVERCYHCMFYNCKRLSGVTIKAETTANEVTIDDVYGALTGWLYGVYSKGGTIYCKKSFYDTYLINKKGTDILPSGWTPSYITD